MTIDDEMLTALAQIQEQLDSIEDKIDFLYSKRDREVKNAQEVGKLGGKPPKIAKKKTKSVNLLV